ncbi:tetratricopeptide repeat protein, partial [Planctomycetota bacterium]
MARRRRRNRRRLNKTVAIIGIAVFALIVLVGIVALSYRHKDPSEYLARAETAYAAEDYETAELNYKRAIGGLKDRELKVELFFKLARTYMHTDQWPKVFGCWNRITVEDPSNIQARLLLLNALYTQADSQTRAGWQVGQTWKEVETQTAELIAVAERTQVLGRPLTDWQGQDDVLQADTSQTDDTLGERLFLLRGRAAYEQASIGAVTDPGKWLDKAGEDLEQVLVRDPAHVEAYWYLSRVLSEKGEVAWIRGDSSARAQAAAAADKLLEKAVQVAPDNPRAHINLLEAKLERIRTFKQEEQDRRRQLELLQHAYQQLTETFGQSPDAFAAQARFYWIQAFFADAQQRQTVVATAVKAAEKAIALAPTRVDLILALAELHYRMSFMADQPAALQQALNVARQALASPEAEDTSGPRTFANKANRMRIFSFTANVAIEQVLLDPEALSVSARQAAMTEAQESVRQIEQLLGSGDDPEVAKWRGMLSLARGQIPQAARELYAVYEKTKASSGTGRADPVVSYALARICLDSPELGKAIEFLSAALKAGIGYVRPHIILDYLELLGRLDMWAHVLSPTNTYSVISYESYFGSNARSRHLHIRALIGSQRFADAEQALARLDSQDPETILLKLTLIQARLGLAHKAQVRATDSTVTALAPLLGITGESITTSQSDGAIQGLRAQHVSLLQQLLSVAPQAVEESSLAAALQYLIKQGQLSEARALVTPAGRTITHSAVIRFYQQLLDEPDPQNVTPERLTALRELAIQGLPDPLQRSVELGLYYQQQQQADRALDTWMTVLETTQLPDVTLGINRTTRLRHQREALAAGLAMGLALDKKDWHRAEAIRYANLDGCQGELFEAQLASTRGRHTEALTKVNHCLELRPLYSHGYLLRSQIHTALGQDADSLADVELAAMLNPTGPMIAKAYVNGLLLRNRDPDARVSDVQKAEILRAIERALRLDPTDMRMLGIYAQHIMDTDPARAVAIYQAIVKRDPTLEKLTALGEIATRVAAKEQQTQRQDVYYDIARVAFEQAAAIDRQNPQLLQSYARYFRLRGMAEKAEALLQQAPDRRLLWQHHLQQGQLDAAQRVLEQAYAQTPKDEQTLQGLLLVAQQRGDAETIQRYAAELVDVADTFANRIEQITSLLRLGLVQEANTQLEVAGRRFPNESKVTLLEGWVAMRMGRLPEALAKIDASLETDRESAVGWYLRGQVQLLLGEAKQAVEDLRRSKVLDDNPATRLTLAKAFLQMKRRDEALVELQQAVTEPGAPVQTRFLLEQLYRDTGKLRELEAYYGQMQRLFPQDIHWLNQAASLALENRDIARAEKLFAQACTQKRQAYKNQPAQIWAQDRDFLTACHGHFQTLIAGAAARPAKLTQVLAEARLYNGTPFEPITRLYAAEAKLKQGRQQEAMNDCRLALTLGIQGGDLGGLVARAETLFGSEGVTQRSTQLQQNEATALAGYLVAFHQAHNSERFDQASAAIDRCLSLVKLDDPRYEAYQRQKAHSLTIAYEKTSDQKNRQSAISVYESLLQKTPTSTNVLNNLAYLLADGDERLSDAVAYAEKAWGTQPNNPVILDTYGYVLLKDRQYER